MSIILHRGLRRDLIFSVSVVVAMWVLGIYFDLYELIYDLLHQYEAWELDELLVALLSVSIVATWFSYRRWRESERAYLEVHQSNLSLNKFSQAVHEAGESVMITDRNATIEYVNPAFTQITGYAQEEVLGNNPSILKSHAQDPSFYKELWETITAGRVWHGTLIDRRKDGSFYPGLMSVAPIHDEHGEITHFVSLQQDMTEHERLEAQFLQAQKMEAVGTLVGGIAHDFNNMLAALQGNVFLAKRKLDDPSVVGEKLQNVESLSMRAADVVHQLLTFARKDMVELRNIPLQAFIKEAVKLAKSAIPENVSFTKEITEQNIIVKGDATQLQQIVMNLLNNARDAVSDAKEPAIHMGLAALDSVQAYRDRYPDSTAEKFVHLYIQDNGCGIPDNLLDKVMNPFFTTKGVGKGTGLGLAMVYGAVETHGGLIEVESRQGKGTTFHIYLPIVEQEESSRDRSPRSAIKGQGELVLLVDDEESILESMGEVLRTLGYLVVEATDGATALDYYEDHTDEVSIVICDVVMPVMGGIELMKSIQRSNNPCPVILMTGYDSSERLQDVESIEGCELMHKPVSIGELTRKIRVMLDKE